MSQKLLLACALGSMLTASGAHAQPYETPPPPAAPRALNIDAPAEHTLPNGLRVIVARRPGVQLVTAQLLLLSGAETDPVRRAGRAAITAEMLTKGTRRHSASALASAAEALGGSLDSGASWNRSTVSITVSAPMIDAALGLVSETVLQPTFAQAELDRLRAHTLDGLKVAYTQPGFLATVSAERLLFGSGPYGHPASGSPVSLPRITRADLVAQHAQNYRPDNAVLILAGDIDTDAARQLATRHFGHWRKPIRPLPEATAAGPGTGLPQSFAIIDMPSSDQAAVTLAVSVPPRGLDRAVADVTNSVLGGGYSSRLNQEIRIKRGLSYGAGSQLDARRQGGLLRASVQTKNESAAEVVALLQSEFDRLASTPVSDDELGARKAALIGEYSRSVETTAGLSAAVSGLVVAGLPTAELRRRISALTEVNASDVQRYAATYLGTTQRRVVVVAGESAKFSDALRAAIPKGSPAIAVVKQSTLNLESNEGLARP